MKSICKAREIQKSHYAPRSRLYKQNQASAFSVFGLQQEDLAVASIARDVVV